MSSENFRLSGEKCQQLIELLEAYKATKPVQLHARFVEIIESLKKESSISGVDAYQARYIRDCLTFHKEKAVPLADVTEFIEKKFFPPEVKAAPAPAATATPAS
ncbi:MAG: hypothetical protein A2X86_13505 [Bdellovibrionales bacterium GWA2_49_15]|nr:MAG: hypothetical protein A2X86_13505 [Bdellovibrionales bacterium GWA2_49_15]HAZ13542.1 hypothetical protein [Bdellovibrionales bacterium]